MLHYGSVPVETFSKIGFGPGLFSLYEVFDDGNDTVHIEM